MFTWGSRIACLVDNVVYYIVSKALFRILLYTLMHATYSIVRIGAWASISFHAEPLDPVSIWAQTLV